MDPSAIKCPPGLKKKLIDFAQCQGPHLHEVTLAIARIIQNGHLTAYHLSQKLQEINAYQTLLEIDNEEENIRMRKKKEMKAKERIFASKFAGKVEKKADVNRLGTELKDGDKKMSQADINSKQIKIKTTLFDISKMYAQGPNCAHTSLDDLCKNELNTQIVTKRSFPFAYSEAKIAMALYQKYSMKQSGNDLEFERAITPNLQEALQMVNSGDKYRLKKLEFQSQISRENGKIPLTDPDIMMAFLDTYIKEKVV